MLYAKALREGLSELPTSTPEVRDKIGNLLKEKAFLSYMKRLKSRSGLSPALISKRYTKEFRGPWRSMTYQGAR